MLEPCPLKGGYLVSIHAPLKGATANATERSDDFEVSIHAPLKGATALAEMLTKHQVFQFTHP